jgi:hypothetical protein
MKPQPSVAIQPRPVFKKGEEIVLFSNWDRKGTFAYYFVTVKSCGLKKLTLELPEGHLFNRNYDPVIAGGKWGEQRTNILFYKSMSKEASHAKGMQLASHCIAYEASVIHEKMNKNSGNSRYCAALEKDLELLHEPRVFEGINKINGQPLLVGSDA